MAKKIAKKLPLYKKSEHTELQTKYFQSLANIYRERYREELGDYLDQGLIEFLKICLTETRWKKQVQEYCKDQFQFDMLLARILTHIANNGKIQEVTKIFNELIIPAAKKAKEKNEKVKID